MPKEDRQRRFWGWPGVNNLAYAYFVLGPLLTACFIVVYAGADCLTGLHHYRLPLFFEWELSIPFLPATVLFYNSLHVAYSIAPFILRTRAEMNAMALVWVLITLLGGIGFLVVPFETGYPPPAVDSLGPWRAMYHLADDANLTFNCFPSLHVAWAIACLDVYSQKAGRSGKLFLAVWGAAIMLSTLFTHFHHVADVAGGFLLAMFGSRLLYHRLHGPLRPPGAGAG